MSSIAQLFSNFDDFSKPKSINDTATTYTKNNMIYTSPTPALSQGAKFNKYQQKIHNNLEKQINYVNSKEGFQGLQGLQLNGNGLTAQSDKVIRANEMTESEYQSSNNLNAQYNSTIADYATTQENINKTATNYMARVNSSNPYLNTVVNFKTGQSGYVTNMGVFKYIPTSEILNSITVSNNPMSLEVPWDKSYTKPGAVIPSKPTLMTGTPVQLGQALGNEGTNLFVNSLISNPESSYVGCYADNTTSPLMTFIGYAPPQPTAIVNGNFDQPQIATNTYQYITSSTDILGWNFSAVLVNQSTAWGYPMPYPNGPQCACIQGTQTMFQTINFTSGSTYSLSFYACNRPNYTGNTVSIQIQTTSGDLISTIYTVTPPLTWTNYSTTFTVSTTQNYNLCFIGTNGDGNMAIQNIQLSLGSQTSGTYSYSECQQAAIDNEYQYFALQNANAETGLGYCAASNDEPTITSLGESYVPSEQLILWSSNTSGDTGNSAILNVSGALSVVNSSGKSIYSSNTSAATPSNYLGCYGDSSVRAMTLYNGGSQSYDLDSCQQIAQQENASLFALQDSTSGTNAQCAISSDFAQASEYGPATNCTQISGGTWSGGGWSNAIYNTTTPNSNYYLILEDSGECCIYRGTGPSDNQGLIWTAKLSQSPISPNPSYAASQGIYGQNWITSGSTLAAGDFVGSPNGYIALIMQSDGNLVLCTYEMELNCSKMASTNYKGGGVGANALYNIGQVGVQANMSNLAYIDQNSELHPYPSSNSQYSDTYTTNYNIMSTGTTIGSALSNSTVDSCTTACNNNPDCIGFNFYNDSCEPLSSNPSTIQSSGANLYTKNFMPLNPPIGVPTTTNNIDSILYGTYLNGGPLAAEYGLTKAISGQEIKSHYLENIMNTLSSQISNMTGAFSSGSENAESQSQQNVKGIAKYLYDIKKTNSNIKDFDTNVENILKDSDIVVLQKNYNYLLWSILAIGIILIAMNVIKNNTK